MEKNLDEFNYMIINVEYLLNGSLKSKILRELTVSEFGAVCLELGTDCIIEAVMLPVNNYIIIPFNVPPLWYGIICQNIPKYPIVTGVTIIRVSKILASILFAFILTLHILYLVLARYV